MTGRRDDRSEEAKGYRKLYKTARWLQTRKAQLTNEPLCRFCKAQGRTTVAIVCDHIDPKAKLDPDTFFAGPYQSLCKPCHDGDKQRIEKGGVARIGCGADGWPLTP